MNKHVESFEAMFRASFNHFTFHDRGIIEAWLVELKDPKVLDFVWTIKKHGASDLASEIHTEYKTKSGTKGRYFYINDITYWRSTGRDIFEVIGHLDAAGKFEVLNNPHLMDAFFTVMHMGDEDNVDDAVFHYQLRNETLVQTNLRRYNGLVKVRWPQ